MCFGVRNKGKALQLTPCSRGRRYCNERQHRLLRLSDSPVILHLSPIGKQEIDPLGTVHRTAAAQSDQEVWLEILGHLQACGNIFGRGILMCLLEQGELQPCLRQRVHAPLNVPCFDNPRVTRNQSPAVAMPFCQIPQFVDSPRAEQNLSAEVKVKLPAEYLGRRSRLH